MTSGTRTYNSFAEKRAVLERQSRAHATTIHDAERRMQGLVQKQGELWAKMAAIHLNANLELPTSVRKSMDNRHELIEKKTSEIETIKDNLSTLKRTRASKSEARANAAAKLSSDHSSISDRFEADQRVVGLRRRVAELEHSVVEADEKKARAETELAQRRVAYESDELFNYLMSRRYGTPQYAPWFPVTRIMDGRLARATNFLEEKANYDLLLAVPEWTADRIATLTPNLEKARSEFAEIEAEFFDVLTEQESALSAQDIAILEIDRSIATENNAIAKANKFLSDAALAEDSELKRVIADFSAILSKRGFYDLKRLAAQTKSDEDDRIVAQLQEIGDEINRLSRQVEDEKTELFVLERKVKAFEQVERHIRSSGWNDSSHRFNGISPDQLSDRLATDGFTAGAVIGMLANAHEEPRRTDYGNSYGGSTYGGSSWSSGSGYGGGDSSTPTTTDSFGGSSSDSFTTTDSF